MNRIFTFVVLWLCVASLTQRAIAAPTAEANTAGIAVPSTTDATTSDQEQLTRLAQRMAQRADTPPAVLAPSPASVPPAPLAPAKPVTQADLDTAAASSANASLAPVVSPNESRPLGPSRVENEQGARSSTSAISGWFTSTLIALIVVIGAVFLLRAGLSKITGQSPVASNRHVIEILARVSIAPKNHMLLIKLGRRILVVGESGAGMNTLANIDDPEEVAALLQTVSSRKPGSSTAGFDQALGRFDNDYDEADRHRDEGSDHAETRLDRARDNISTLTSRLRNIGSGGRG